MNHAIAQLHAQLKTAREDLRTAINVIEYSCDPRVSVGYGEVELQLSKAVASMQTAINLSKECCNI